MYKATTFGIQNRSVLASCIKQLRDTRYDIGGESVWTDGQISAVSYQLLYYGTDLLTVLVVDTLDQLLRVKNTFCDFLLKNHLSGGAIFYNDNFNVWYNYKIGYYRSLCPKAFIDDIEAKLKDGRIHF